MNQNNNGMHSEIKNARDFFTNGHIYHVPDYQRKYTWKSKQAIELVRDIYNIDDNENLFVGTIIIKNNNIGTQSFLIDGQQRTTTFMILFRAMLDHIKEKDCEIANYEKISKDLENFIYKKETGDKHRRLKIRDLVNGEKFKNLLEDDHISFNKISVKTFKGKSLFHNNYYDLRKYIYDEKIDVEILIQKLNNVLINRIYLTEKESELQIFEAINSKGSPLSSIDLIKNFYFILLRKFGITSGELFNEVKSFFEDEIFKKICKDKKTENKSFSSFIKKVIIYLQAKNFKEGVKHKLPKESDEIDLYNKFKKQMNENFNWFKNPDDISNSLKEIRRILFTLNEIESYKDNSNIKKPYENTLKIFNAIFTGAQFFPIMMFLADHYFEYNRDQNIINKDDEWFGKSILFLERFIVRRYICGAESRSLTRIINNFTFDNYDEMVKVFEDIGIPSDLEFKEGIKDNYFGNRVATPIIRAIIWKIETNEKVSKETLKNQKFEDYTLEHIMPQTLGKDSEWKKYLGSDWKMYHNSYLNRIGNLTISRDNSALGNNSFKDKTIHFKESILSMNKDLLNNTEWTKETIDSRTNELVEKIIKIWE